MSPSAPISELGAVTRGQLPGLPSWINTGGGTEQYEHVPDLLYPGNLDLYLRMSRSTHVKGLSATVFLPIEGFQFYVDQQECDEQTAEWMAQDYGLPLGEDGTVAPQRTAGRFSFKEHLRLALKAPSTYGHAVFEQVAQREKGGPRDGWYALRKLAPRPVRTISEWNVHDDGGLKEIVQTNPRDGQQLPIPIDRCVVYVHDQEPGSWVGEPMIRPLYEAWFYADLLWRLDAVKHDRNSMGVPYAQPKEGQSPTGEQQADALGQMTNVRAGDQAGLVGSEVFDFSMLGVTGATSDPSESAVKHEQRMSRVMLAQLAMMGQTETGSLALSNNFVDLAALGRRKLAQDFCDTFTAHVIEDHLDWQGDPTAPAPRLAFKETDPEQQMAALATAVEKGLIQVDDEIEDQVRRFLKVPPRSKPRNTGPPPGQTLFGEVTAETAGDTPETPDTEGVQVAAAASDAPGAFRRDPTAVEVQAAVDFGALTERWRKQAQKLAETVAAERRTVGQRLAGQVADLFAAGRADEAVALAAPAVGLAPMLAAFKRAVDEGAADHVREAKAQGAKSTAPTLAAAYEAAEKRAATASGLLGSELLGSALSMADRANGPAATAGSIAQAVTGHLASLSDASVVRETGSGVVASTGEGRVAAMQAVTDSASFYASELMDASTCQTCASIDGTEYASLDDALADYPSGAQYVDCEGGPNCRGLLVAVYDETPATLDAPGDGMPLR